METEGTAVLAGMALRASRVGRASLIVLAGRAAEAEAGLAAVLAPEAPEEMGAAQGIYHST